MYTHTYIHVCMYMYINIYVHICIDIIKHPFHRNLEDILRMYIYICMDVRIYVYTYTCTDYAYMSTRSPELLGGSRSVTNSFGSCRN